MKYKQLLSGAAAFLGMLILILDGQTAMEGGRAGVDLCLKTVIPSLFPFFVLSILLTDSFSGSRIPLLRPIGKLCGIPAGMESILISGFLGGYPVGAQSIAAACQSGYLAKEDGERMLAFCNNAGPAFLFGMVVSLFPQTAMVWALWGIHIASALLVALLLPVNSTKQHISPQSSPVSFVSALRSSLTVMATVCGWVILFRVFITFLKKWFLWLLPVEIQTGIIGILELTNGCSELYSVSELPTRFIICSGILAFGGLCVTMQTISVVKGLSMRFYFLGKLLQTAFSVTVCMGILYRNWLPFFAILFSAFLILRKKQKKSSFQQTVRV